MRVKLTVRWHAILKSEPGTYEEPFTVIGRPVIGFCILSLGAPPRNRRQTKMLSLSCMMFSLGVLLVLFGMVLFLKRQRLFGAAVALAGLCVILIPPLVYVYVSATM